MVDKTQIFIDKARDVHGNLYDYSKVEYTGSQVKVLIIDPEHGEFWQTPNKHLSGRGCPARFAASLRMTTEEFIRRAQEVHNHLYNYSKVEYKGAHDKVCIIDPEYGEFWQAPHHHLDGRGHPVRGARSAARKNSKSKDEFVRDANRVHGNLYDYTKSVYVSSQTKVLISDPEYGEFWQTPASHLSGSGHPKRGSVNSGLSRRLTIEAFVEKSREIHGDLYDYSESEYNGARHRISIIDPDYGKFHQLASNHLEGKGHPNRSVRISKPHQEVIEMMDHLGAAYTVNDRLTLPGYELDILAGKVAIEVDGVYWHRHEKLGDKYYHQRKHKLAEDAGVFLLQFFDTEIIENPDIVKSMIAHRLGVGSCGIFARDTTVESLSPGEYRKFLDDNHLQGAVNSSTRLALVLNDEVVAVMGLSTRRGVQVLDRFVSKTNHHVVGGFSKLFSRVNNKETVTHSANRYATGNVYRSNGFSLKSENPYTLYFVYKSKLYPRERFQKHKLHKMFPDYAGGAAREFLLEKGVYPLYAAGTKTWLFTP